jgi:hypothetical protein
MANNITPRRAPGAKQPFVNLNPAPQNANRPPTIYDNYDPSTIWIQPVDTSGNPVNSIWINASTQNGAANWVQVAQQGGAGVFSSLTVTPGNTFLGGSLSVVGPIVTNNNITGNDINALDTLTAVNSIICTNGFISAQNLNNNNLGPNLGMIKFRPPNGSAILGDEIGALNYIGYSGLNVQQTSAGINNVVTAFSTDGNLYIKSALQFYTNGGTLAPSKRVVIDSLGVVTINAPDFPATVGLVVEGGVNAEALYVSGDPGGSAGGLTTFTNSTVAAGGDSTGMIVQTSAGAGTTPSAGFIKIYVGATACYVPYWTQTT